MSQHSTGSSSSNRRPRSRSEGTMDPNPGEQNPLQRASTLANVQQPTIQEQIQIDESKVNPSSNAPNEEASIQQTETTEASSSQLTRGHMSPSSRTTPNPITSVEESSSGSGI
ncbi:hypothetical protein ECG_04933 [Echinococcus granulosus]|nr:hypothetical protein ECG_04933 [Echinococcus granulosus]